MIYDVLIVGGGTAGMTAAVYALRAGKSVAVLEENAVGGQIVNSPEVENFPGRLKMSGFEFAMDLTNQVKALGGIILYDIAIKCERQSDVSVITGKMGNYSGKTVILAMGLKKRKLGIDDEEQLTGAGISYCATCDGAFFRDKEVAITGGGNTAIEDALFLAEYCKKVTVIHRRDGFPRVEKNMLERLQSKENVSFCMNSKIIALQGESMLEAIQIQDKDGNKTKLSISGLFIAVGQIPDNHVFEQWLNLDENGFILAGEECTTQEDWLFVAGDCRAKKVRQLITAAADGAVAGLAAAKSIS